MAIVAAIPPIVGGVLNLLIPETCVRTSRRFLTMLGTGQRVHPIFFSVRLVRIAGGVAVLFGLAVLAAGVFLRE